MKHSEQPQITLLNAAEVMSRLGIKRTSLFCKVRAGIIPPPVNLGTRSLRWRSDTIDAWLASLNGGRRNDD